MEFLLVELILCHLLSYLFHRGWRGPSRPACLAPYWPPSHLYFLSLFPFALNSSLLAASFISSGSLFHCSTALTAKENFLRANWGSSLGTSPACRTCIWEILVLFRPLHRQQINKRLFSGGQWALFNAHPWLQDIGSCIATPLSTASPAQLGMKRDSGIFYWWISTLFIDW